MRTEDPSAYADAWVVRDAMLSAKQTNAYDFMRSVPCTLVFCAGPNAAGSCRRPQGSMARTANIKAARDDSYVFFRACVESALRAGLDAMIHEGIEVALVAKLSCGI